MLDIGARIGYRYNTKAKPLLIFLPPIADFFTLNIYFTWAFPWSVNVAAWTVYAHCWSDFGHVWSVYLKTKPIPTGLFEK